MSADRSRPRALRRPPVVLLVAAVAMAIGTQAATAAPGIFWTNSGANTIGRADPDGGNVDQRFITGVDNPMGLSAVGTHLYWVTGGVAAGAIGRATLNGHDVTLSVFSTTTSLSSGVAVDTGHLYWGAPNAIGRAGLDGAGLSPSFVSFSSSVGQVMVDSSHVYWAGISQHRVGRSDLSGGNTNTSFVAGMVSPRGVAVNAGHVYWTDNQSGKIGRADLDGLNPDQNFITGLSAPQYLAVDGSHIYWTDGNAVGRANLDGSGQDASFISGANSAVGIAVVTAPAAGLSPGLGVYSERTTGTTSASQSFTVGNTGNLPLTVGAASLSGDASQFVLDADTCSGQTVAVGANCVVQVSFAPTSAGAKAATLSIGSDDAASPASAALSGTAIGDPVLDTPPLPVPPPFPVTPGAPTAPRPPAPQPSAAQSAGRLGSGTLRVAVTTVGRLTTTARANVGATTVRIDAAALTVARAGTYVVALGLPARVRARLAAKGRMRISVTSVITAGDGQRAGATRSVLLRAPASRVLRGQWIARVIGPWARAPRLTARERSALRFTRLRGRRVATVVR